MPLIECTAGAASPNVAGDTYNFERDAHGRYVCRVDNYHHVMCLISVEHYRLAADLTEQVPPEAEAEAVAAIVQADAAQQSEPAAQASQEGGADTAPDASGESTGSDQAGDAETAPADDDSESGEQPAAADDLTKISGIGPTIASRLNERGYTTFAQIAALTDEQAKELDSSLNLKGGIERNEWIAQAAGLAAQASQE